jgi:hypothetical protein
MVPASTDFAVLFHCKSGHLLEAVELLQCGSMIVRRGLEDLVDQWSGQQAALLRTVDQARQSGHLDVADIFNRHARSLESRISRVRDAFAVSESSRMIKLPDALRS